MNVNNTSCQYDSQCALQRLRCDVHLTRCLSFLWPRARDYPLRRQLVAHFHGYCMYFLSTNTQHHSKPYSLLGIRLFKQCEAYRRKHQAASLRNILKFWLLSSEIQVHGSELHLFESQILLMKDEFYLLQNNMCSRKHSAQFPTSE